jgi:serine phosphatase RsbU (regulator of sigma subunit)
MFYYYLINFTDTFGNPGWKGLDFNKNIPGSQLYLHNKNEVYLANEEQITITSTDISEITEADYMAKRNEIIAQAQQHVQTVEQQLVQAQTDNQILGSQLFALQTSLLEKGVID